MINRHRPRGPRSLLRVANDAVPSEPPTALRESAQNFARLLGAPGAMRSAPGGLCLGRSTGRPARKQGGRPPWPLAPRFCQPGWLKQTRVLDEQVDRTFLEGALRGAHGEPGTPAPEGCPLRPAGPARPGRAAFLAGRFVLWAGAVRLPGARSPAS